MSWQRADIDELQSRVMTMLQRGTVKSVDDALMMQAVDIELKAGHRPTKVEHWHPYGISMNPLGGSEVLVAALGGNQDHMIVLGTADRRHRIKVAPGEMAIHDDQGQIVHLKRGGVHVKSALGITLEGPITITGNIVMTGDFTQNGVHVDSNGPHTA